MKFPKPRANLYLVIRDDHTKACCGGFSEPEDAHNFAAACGQEWKDKYPNWKDIPMFVVHLTTFYG